MFDINNRISNIPAINPVKRRASWPIQLTTMPKRSQLHEQSHLTTKTENPWSNLPHRTLQLPCIALLDKSVQIDHVASQHTQQPQGRSFSGPGWPRGTLRSAVIQRGFPKVDSSTPEGRIPRARNEYRELCACIKFQLSPEARHAAAGSCLPSWRCKVQRADLRPWKSRPRPSDVQQRRGRCTRAPWNTVSSRLLFTQSRYTSLAPTTDSTQAHGLGSAWVIWEAVR